MIIDNKESFIPEDPKIAVISIISDKISGHRNTDETRYSLLELKQLLYTLRLTCLKEYVQKIKHIDPAFVIGEGKIQEIIDGSQKYGYNLLVFDVELSPSQHRNIQEKTKLDVIDRNMIILEIFAKHARTKDAKMQIEISKLEYLLPRLNSVWTRFLKPKGGASRNQGGGGETQKELNRRFVKERIAYYKKENEAIERNLLVQKKKREENIYSAALVGYTNAGKSSVMNRLCDENIQEEDKLFTTVDATYRTLVSDFKPPVILIDTVGFISNLPAQLITGFRTTLASVREAHFLIIISDISHPNCREQLRVTFDVLKELAADGKPRIILFNKKDRISENPEAKNVLDEYPNHILISSFEESDIKKLKTLILDYFGSLQEDLYLCIPFSDGYALAKVMEQGNVIESKNLEDGILYHISLRKDAGRSAIFKKYFISSEDPRIERAVI